MALFHVTVTVTLKPEILDPAGEATQGVLRHLGYALESLRIGRHFDLAVKAPDADQAKKQATAMAEELLAHPVMEIFRVEVSS